VRSLGSAALPLLFPFTVCAAICAAFAFVTALSASIAVVILPSKISAVMTASVAACAERADGVRSRTLRIDRRIAFQ
jgi:hypothetical protein